ncbi:hypothetical protein [Alicyclobacillus sp. ALC3]|uniref:hypothetical protein n=1 Tax=Alicyclobacillus sp. ALC3 TaxID=2796143 RepID=UPI00237927E4|nr:hypothetical protein [Alicyclobacillus sp. ALC3]WDL95890.1 hypothetical protein JC200_16235 [Alicyclobacillus sp. ALC3]
MRDSAGPHLTEHVTSARSMAPVSADPVSLPAEAPWTEGSHIAAVRMHYRRLRVGDRIRIRPTAKSQYAGCEGVVTYVGRTVCDVKLEFGKRKRRTASGGKQQEYVETAYETLPKEEIESIKPHVELIRFVSGTRRGQSRTLASYLLAAACVAAAVYFFVIH